MADLKLIPDTYDAAKAAGIVKEKKVTNEDGTESLVEYYIKATVPPSVAYRATCGKTVLQSSMTVHQDEPKSQDAIKGDHDTIIEALAAEVSRAEDHRIKLVNL
jgi:hypothetical protein